MRTPNEAIGKLAAKIAKIAKIAGIANLPLAIQHFKPFALNGKQRQKAEDAWRWRFVIGSH
jgi:hypothetical protein